jgi:hypothetical protein
LYASQGGRCGIAPGDQFSGIVLFNSLDFFEQSVTFPGDVPRFLAFFRTTPNSMIRVLVTKGVQTGFNVPQTVQQSLFRRQQPHQLANIAIAHHPRLMIGKLSQLQKHIAFLNQAFY